MPRLGAARSVPMRVSGRCLRSLRFVRGRDARGGFCKPAGQTAWKETAALRSCCHRRPPARFRRGRSNPPGYVVFAPSIRRRLPAATSLLSVGEARYGGGTAALGWLARRVWTPSPEGMTLRRTAGRVSGSFPGMDVPFDRPTDRLVATSRSWAAWRLSQNWAAPEVARQTSAVRRLMLRRPSRSRSLGSLVRGGLSPGR